MEIEQYRGWEQWEQIAAEWESLRLRLGRPAFEGPDFARSHLLAYAAASVPRVVVARDHGGLVGVLPLLEERTRMVGMRLRRLRSAAEGSLFRYGLLSAASEVAAAVWCYLARQDDWELAQLHNVIRGAGCDRLAALAVAAGWRSDWVETTLSPVLDLDAAGEPGSGHFRKTLRRNHRQLGAVGAVASERLQPGPAEIDLYAALETAGWKGRAGSAMGCLEQELACYRACAARFDLYRLRAGATIVAQALGMSGRESFHLAKITYDEAYARYGPGQLLIDAMVRDCRARGLRQFHFEGGDDAYKRQWSTTVVVHGNWYIYRRGWKTRMIARLRAWKWAPRMRGPWK